jgi:uncharacterized membrane protein
MPVVAKSSQQDDPLHHQPIVAGMSVSTTYSGPIPPPEFLKQYNEIEPGSAARILAMAEQQTKHRISLEKMVVSAEIKRSWWGLVAGFVISMSFLIGGCIVIALGHDAAGGTIATTAVVSLTTVFVYGTKQRRAEREEKAKLVQRKK